MSFEKPIRKLNMPSTSWFFRTGMSALASLLVCGAVWVGGSKIDDGVVREIEDSRPAGFN